MSLIVLRKQKKHLQQLKILSNLSGNGFIGQGFMKYESFDALLEQHAVAYFTLFTSSMQVPLQHIIKFSCKPVQQFYGQYDIMRSEFQRYVHQDYTVVVLVETETKVERIQSMLMKCIFQQYQIFTKILMVVKL